MSFNQDNFTPMGGDANSNSPNSWSYRSSDTLTEITASGYFTKKYPVLNDGDLITISASDQNAIGFFSLSGNEFSVLASTTISATIGTGWAQYADDSLSSGSPQVVNEGVTAVLTNNAANVISSQLPNGVTSLYDGAKITPENSGDMYMIRINLTAFTSSQNGVLEIALDIGGTQNVILAKDVSFPRGTGLANARDISESFLVYSLGTFVANGGEIKVTSVTGNTSIYDVTYVISRVHKAA